MLSSLLLTEERDACKALHPSVLQSLRTHCFAFVDARYHVWRSLQSLLSQLENSSPELRAEFASLCLDVAREMGPPQQTGLSWIIPPSSSEEKSYSSQKRAFSRFWSALMSTPMTGTTYKSILANLEREVVPFVKHPVVVVDFCMAAYNMGGHTAVLSLQALFHVSVKLNVEVPQFYPKVYALLDTPGLFVSKYRDQFCELLDAFLSSEYLPLSYAASFAKKLCRLALSAPSYGTVICLQLVFNILRRHPMTLQLIHFEKDVDGQGDVDGGNDNSESSSSSSSSVKETTTKKRKWRHAVAVDRRKEMSAAQRNCYDAAGEDDLVLVGEEKLEHSGDEANEEDVVLMEVIPAQEDERAGNIDSKSQPLVIEDVIGKMASDPFLANEQDPGETRALESSLWELEALRHHYLGEAADLAQSFSQDMQRALFEMDSLSSASTKTILDKMRKRKVKQGVALEHRFQPSILSEELAEFYE